MPLKHGSSLQPLRTVLSSSRENFCLPTRKNSRPCLAHPSVKVLGHRNDVAELMRKSDILVLPSIEEGFGLVIAEAMGSGCVPLASEACTEICRHMKTGLMHKIGDVEALDSTHHDAARRPRAPRKASRRIAAGVARVHLDGSRRAAPRRISRDHRRPQSWRRRKSHSESAHPVHATSLTSRPHTSCQKLL